MARSIQYFKACTVANAVRDCAGEVIAPHITGKKKRIPGILTINRQSGSTKRREHKLKKLLFLIFCGTSRKQSRYLQIPQTSQLTHVP